MMTIMLDDQRLQLGDTHAALVAALARDQRVASLSNDFGAGSCTIHYSPAEVEVFVSFKTSRQKRK